MKKFSLPLKIIGVFVLLLLLFLFLVFRFFDTTFLHFEDDYTEKTTFEQRTEAGFTFLDRNANGQLEPYEDDRLPLAERVEDVLSRMTIEEKIHLLKGSGTASAMGETAPGGVTGAVGTMVATPRLGLPTLYLSDGPAGLRISPTREGEDRTYFSTAFPIATQLASTWNEALINEIGKAMGEEARDYGVDVILGPGANIHRHPLCGRNFEYFSEDPLLSGYMGAAIVNGIESQGIGASVKHFVANNQETWRNFNDVIVSERALREIYLKGFEHIVKRSQPWAIMSSYNKVGGSYTSESEQLLSEVLRNDWGFEGMVMTDWFGGKNAPQQIRAGNDLLEPGTNRQWKALRKAHTEGSLSEAIIDRALRRILTVVFKSQKMQNYQRSNQPDLAQHAALARYAAAEGIVLLKNEGVLPLADSLNVALLGVSSYELISGGTGSGDVNEAYTISLQQGLAAAGYQLNVSGAAIFETHRKNNAEGFVKPEGVAAIFTAYTPPEIEYTQAQLDEMVATSDIGVITLGRNSGEFVDRYEKGDFLLTDQEQQQITKICERFHLANKKVVLVLNVGGVIETASWKAQPDAILLAWQGGQEGGNAITDVLKGAVNPSGKLPATFPMQLSDHASDANFPKNRIHIKLEDMFIGMLLPPEERTESEKIRDEDFTYYEEGVYVGYRHFDKKQLEVSYPFGFGLSYTEFDFSDLRVSLDKDTLRLSTTVKNIGKLSGKEVVQVYIEKNNSLIDRPIKELKAFLKTDLLDVNEIQNIKMDIPINELSYWDESSGNWSFEKGDYKINIGTSSRDIRQTYQIEL